MADYVPKARSNYFAVRDRAAFLAWCETRDLTPIRNAKDTLDGFLCDQGIPTSSYNEETDDDGDIDFFAELAEHLADEHVAICMEIGSERLRYLIGYAMAVNHAGETHSIDLNEIYVRAAPLGAHIARFE
jgi:hypothetical protein